MATIPDADKHALTPQQQAAADALAAGATITDAADAVGVTRQTVSEWANHHPGFRAEMNARRWELWNGATDRLRLMIPKALDAVAAALDAGSVPAALGVLKLVGLQDRPGVIGPNNPALIAARDADAALMAKVAWG